MTDKPKQPITAHQALQLMLVGMKLGGALTWSWWLVFIPTYASVFFASVAAIAKSWSKKQVAKAARELEKFPPNVRRYAVREAERALGRKAPDGLL